MAAKLLHSLTDDNPDLQKQIGCMTGIFQLFERQQLLTTRRIIGHTPKRLPPPGGSHFNCGTPETESSILYNRSAALEKHSSKHVQEKQRLSKESSRASFSSSSCSSSFSSVDFNKTAQLEPLSFDRMIFSEIPLQDTGISQLNSSPQFVRQTVDLREVVRDSMYREVQGLPVKTANRDEASDFVGKHRDSPRPIQLSRASDGSCGPGPNGEHALPVDLKESLRVRAKLQESPWYGSKPRELSRSSSYHSKHGSCFSAAKEASRFSYDGREMHHASFESRDLSKSSLKFKELPRLSLDNRENSMRSFSSDSQPDLFRNPLQKDIGSSNHNISNQQQTSGTQIRPPGVVAKLMGLEGLPSSVSSGKSKMTSNKTSSIADSSCYSRSSNVKGKQVQISTSTKNLKKEPNSPYWTSLDSVMKPISKFPIEPAPWKQLDGSRSSQKLASKGMKAPAKFPSSLPSVYSEIERRLKDLEFSHFGKDLRALKQILESMQVKGLLETSKGEDLSFATQKDLEQSYTDSMPNGISVNQIKPQNDLVSTSTKRGTHFSRNSESPIVIMKPAKLVEKSGIPASSIISLDDLSGLPKSQGGAFVDSSVSYVNTRGSREQSPKSTSRDNGSNEARTSNRILKSTQSSMKSSQSSKDSSTGSIKGAGSISPRMQKKRLELERHSRPPIPPSDANRSRRYYNKQADSSSPGGRRRLKSSNFQQSDDQLSEISNESKNLNYYENENSAQSDGSILSKSRTDIEVTSSERSPEMSSGQSPSMKASRNLVSGLIEKKSTLMSIEDELLMDHPVVAPEYPSPVSVLDSGVDMDDSPSPMKCITKIVRGDESQESDRVLNSDQCNPASSLIGDEVGSGPTSEINRKKLQNIENLVKKLQRLNSSHDEARTDYIASLCENTNPDHRYISEILLASGLLLMDLGSSLTNLQFHPSGHPVNPELFLVLEQTKASTFVEEECAPEKAVQFRSKEKIRRKLIFDTINEILGRKLAFLGPSLEPWLRPPKLARKQLNAQKLLRELCLETEQLEDKKPKCSIEDEGDGLRNVLGDEVMQQSEIWTDLNGEISGIALDIERSIFKDLVDEVLIGQAPCLRNKPAKRRQLFAK